MRKYIEFLKYSLGQSLTQKKEFQNIDWKTMLSWAESQAIVGIIYQGILKADDSLTMPFDLLMEWTGYTQQIRIQNSVINKKCVDVVREYSNNRFNCMILKGQGNAQYYPDPLSRTPGDIDVLISSDVKRDEITQYVLKNKKVTGHHYHHIEYNEDGIQVEVHYYACSQNNPISMKRLNRWLDTKAKPISITLSDVEVDILVPSWGYNVVYQLAHMMHHFFDEGIGLRQMIDYYFLLKARNNDERSKREDVRGTLKYLNLYHFAGAVMYIMKEVLGIEEQYLIVPVDERRGKTLFKEILKGGNFGHSDVRWKKAEGRWHTGKKYFLKIARNIQFVKEYPAEALCEPVFRTWHYFWRMWQY